MDLTLLSVWSPSWTLSISVASVWPVTAAMNSTRAVLPQPMGPSSSTGFWEATARASRLRFRHVESTSTTSFWFTWLGVLWAVLGRTTPHTATTFWHRSSEITWPLVNLQGFSWRHMTEPWLVSTRAFSTSSCWASSKALMRKKKLCSGALISEQCT